VITEIVELAQAPEIKDFATIPLGLDIAAVSLGAVQGAVFATRMAEERKLDVLAIAIVGIGTALGGGIIRDVLMNQLPAALSDGRLIIAAIVAALGGMLLAPALNRIEPLVVAVDAAALGMWVTVGCAKAVDRQLGTVAVVFIGVITCVGGSVVRDILLQTRVAIMRVGSFYAIAALFGAVTFVNLDDFSNSRTAGIAAAVVTFVTRMGAVRYGWQAPVARPVDVHRILAVGKRARAKIIK
jgi:uncharacterized membrane protein YeiH